MYFSFVLEKWQIDSIKSIIDLENGLQSYNVICQIKKHPGNNEAFIVSGGIVPSKSCEVEIKSIKKKML